MSSQAVLFWIFSILGLAGAIGLIINRSPVYAALSLIVNFFSIAGLYLSLSAEFLMGIQIVVYAGAIMVLFVFVIMLLNMNEEAKVERLDVMRGMSFILAAGFVAEMIAIFKGMTISESNLASFQSGSFSFGQVEPIGNAMMTHYLFPFEMISVVLIAGLIGAIVITKKNTYPKP